MACRGNIFLLNASAEFAKGAPKHFIPAEAVRRIAETFSAWREVEKYSRVVSREEIAKNDYNISPSGEEADVSDKELSDMRGVIGDRIITLRGQTVILDADLAEIYGVSTKALNQAVKRNAERFPIDFVFRLNADELEILYRSRSQTVTLKRGMNIKYPPFAFTEHGAIMAATVLNSPQAVQISVFVVRAFVAMRSALMDTRELARKLARLESEVKARLDTQDAAIVDILRRFMDIIDPGETPAEETPRKRIGFGVKERRTAYRTRR
jgi:phage regulator Rha-like protein